MANSKLANKDDLVMLNALNANTAVDAFEQHYAQDVDETTFIADDEENEDDEENAEGAPQTINTRLGKPTSPVTVKIANVGR